MVLVKQVPDTKNIIGKAMKDDGTINRAALPAIFNPEDLHALEAALWIKDQEPKTRINVLTMGPPSAIQILKESLYRGADFVALITDRKFAGADTLATSYALSCAIKKIGKVDLVFTGRQAIDGDTAQVGPQTAEKLEMNQISCVADIINFNKNDQTLIARRSIEGGYELVKTKFPVLLTITDEEFIPRPPSARLVMAYKNAIAIATNEANYDECYMNSATCEDDGLIALWDISSIKADPKLCGLAGSPTKVKKIDSVVLKSQGIRMVDATEPGITSLVHDLIVDHTIG